VTPEIVMTETPDDLAREAAGRFLDAAGRAIAERGRFAVAVSGGTGPKKLFALLAQPPYSKAVDWPKVHVFFADERYVPHDHPDSNLLLARENLLDHVPIPAANIHPMPTADASPEAAAAQYADTLAAFFAGGEPRFDLMLLGMGPDGHTASLFPGHPDPAGWVAAIHDSPKPPPVRLTLTLDLINRSREIAFLVSGADKEATVKTVLGPADGVEPLPAARVRAAEGRTVWLLDRAAGAGLI
jgi:6-phosphogluconolactonase